jgi:hypothetical protein
MGCHDAAAQVKLGVKGGINLTDLRLNTKTLDKDNRRGFFFGPTLKIAIPLLPLGFDIAALYDQREITLKDEEKSWDVITKEVTFPINVRLTFGSSKTLAVFIFGGPQFGFTINDELNVVDNYRSWKNQKSKFSVNLGAGILLGNTFQVSANYNLDCNKDGSVTINDIVEQFKERDSKMNAWQLAATVYF